MQNISLGEPITTNSDSDQYALALEAAATLDDVKGQDIVLLDLSSVSSFADYFVIVTGDSQVHMRALADRIREMMAKKSKRIGHSEGRDSDNWILLDYYSTIVHIFSKPARAYYVIEELWGDAKTVHWNNETAVGEKEGIPCH